MSGSRGYGKTFGRTLALAGALAAVALGGSAGSAGAAVPVGQVAGALGTNNCPPYTALLTEGVSSGPDFVVPSAGVLVSWSTETDSTNIGTDAKLKVYRATADPDEFLVVGQSAFQAFSSDGVQGPFPARVAVQPGDYVSILPGANGGPCNALSQSTADEARVTQGAGDTPNGQTTPFAGCCNVGERANVEAILEPDADNDGYGDETQDACPSAAALQAPPCAAAPSKTARPDKKCKRLKRKLKKQQRGLARAGSDAKRAQIQGNIADTRSRLRKLGC
jgi:hypothetical protein